MSFHNDRFLYLHYLKWRFESPPVEEQTAEHAVVIDPVAGVLAPCVHQKAAVAGYAELTVGHGRGVGVQVVVGPQLHPVGRVGVVYVATIVEIYAARQAVAA